MKRVVRWVWNGVTVLSLLLCATTLVLWMQSYRGSSKWSWNRDRNPHSLDSWAGGIVYEIDENWPDITRPEAVEYSEPEYHWGMWGFVSAAGRIPQIEGDILTSTYSRWWRVPYWFAAILLAAAQLPVIRRCAEWRRRRVRVATHQCPDCGYDLRASKDHCPECGTPIARPSRAATI